MARGKGEDGPHPVDRHVGRRVCEKRLALGYNQSDLGRALGLAWFAVDRSLRDIAVGELLVPAVKAACADAGIIIAGGHSIDNPEPVFGLAVTGSVLIANLKQNNKAQPGSLLYLTKPLGVGILATAQKKGLLEEQHASIAADSMVILNDVGLALSAIEEVTALTDVTGFGLMGHLLEVCEGSNVSAILQYHKIPVFDEIHGYLDQKCVPGGTLRNWDSYGHKVYFHSEKNKVLQKNILADPQTSGGLLIAVAKDSIQEVIEQLKQNGLADRTLPIGEITEAGDFAVSVID